MTNNIEHNLDILSNEYNGLINYLSSGEISLTEELHRNFGKTSQEFRTNFGDKKALLIFMVALEPNITAAKAAKQLDVSSRTVQTYFNELKTTVIERVGPDKGGYWNIKIK